MKSSYNFCSTIEAVVAHSFGINDANAIVINMRNVSDNVFKSAATLMEKEKYNEFIVSPSFFVMEYKEVFWESFSEINNDIDCWICKVIEGKVVDYV